MSKYKVTDEEFVGKWGPIRKKGYYRFLLVQGGVMWGLFSALIYLVLTSIAEKVFPGSLGDSVLNNLYIQLTIFFIFGVVMAAIVWKKSERRYLDKKPYSKKI